MLDAQFVPWLFLLTATLAQNTVIPPFLSDVKVRSYAVVTAYILARTLCLNSAINIKPQFFHVASSPGIVF